MAESSDHTWDQEQLFNTPPQSQFIGNQGFEANPQLHLQWGLQVPTDPIPLVSSSMGYNHREPYRGPSTVHQWNQPPYTVGWYGPSRSADWEPATLVQDNTEHWSDLNYMQLSQPGCSRGSAVAHKENCITLVHHSSTTVPYLSYKDSVSTEQMAQHLAQ